MLDVHLRSWEMVDSRNRKAYDPSRPFYHWCFRKFVIHWELEAGTLSRVSLERRMSGMTVLKPRELWSGFRTKKHTSCIPLHVHQQCLNLFSGLLICSWVAVATMTDEVLLLWAGFYACDGGEGAGKEETKVHTENSKNWEWMTFSASHSLFYTQRNDSLDELN